MPPQRPDEPRNNGHQRLETLAANTSTVVWFTAPDGSAVDVNPSWAAFTGQDFEAYSGWGWTDVVHPADRLAMLQAWRAATAARRTFEQVYRLRRRDGEYRFMQAHGTPVLEGDAVREWVGVCIDVTASRQTQTALQESELRFRFLDQLGQATRTLNEASEVMEVTARLLGEYLGATRCAYADVEADSDHFTIRNDWSMPGVPSSARPLRRSARSPARSSGAAWPGAPPSSRRGGPPSRARRTRSP